MPVGSDHGDGVGSPKSLCLDDLVDAEFIRIRGIRRIPTGDQLVALRTGEKRQ